MLVLCLNVDLLFIFVGRRPLSGSCYRSRAWFVEGLGGGAETDGGWGPFIILPLAILWNRISYHHACWLASELRFLKTEKLAFLAVTESNHSVIQIGRQRSREIKSLNVANTGTVGVWRRVPRILVWCSLVPVYSQTILIYVQLNKMKSSLVRGCQPRTNGTSSLLLHNSLLFFSDYKSSAHSLCFTQQKDAKKVKVTKTPYILRSPLVVFFLFSYTIAVFLASIGMYMAPFKNRKLDLNYSNSLTCFTLSP